MIKRNKIAQSSQMWIIGLMLVLVAGSMFAFGQGGSKEDNREDTEKVPDNFHLNDMDGSGYEERENREVNLLTDNLTDSNSKGNIEVNCGEDTCELKDLFTNLTETIDKETLIDYVGELDSGDNVKKIWYNTEFDNNGFDNYFQAILVYNENWNNYKLLWSVEDEDFIIPQLEQIKISDLDSNLVFAYAETGSNYLKPATFKTKYGLTDDNYIYVNMDGDEMTNYFGNVISFIFEDNVDNSLKLLKRNYGTYHNGVGRIIGKGFEVLSSNIITHQEHISCVVGGNYDECVFNKQYALNDVEQFSYDRIAVNQATRTTGFNLVSITKQEMTNSGARDEKQAKILSKEKFDNVLENGVGNRAYTTFSDVNIEDVMNGFNDNAISLWGDSVNHNAYGLGTSQSEDFDLTDGFVIDGYFTTQNDLTALEVGSYEFDSSNSLGLVMEDTGEVNVIGSQMVGENFGKFTFNNENSSLYFTGTAYVVNDVEENGEWISLWDRVYAGMINLFDYSFDYELWLTQKVTNGKFSPVDVYDSCGIEGCSYGYVSTFKDEDNSNIQLVSQKPITELLGYNGKQYWAFWKLETKDNKEGCLIIDMPTTNLGRIPISVCDKEITGMNSYAQFKMLGVSEE